MPQPILDPIIFLKIFLAFPKVYPLNKLAPQILINRGLGCVWGMSMSLSFLNNN